MAAPHAVAATHPPEQLKAPRYRDISFPVGRVVKLGSHTHS